MQLCLDEERMKTSRRSFEVIYDLFSYLQPNYPTFFSNWPLFNHNLLIIFTSLVSSECQHSKSIAVLVHYNFVAMGLAIKGVRQSESAASMLNLQCKAPG